MAEIYVSIDGKPIDFSSYPWVVAPLDSKGRRIAVKKGSQIGFSIMLVVRALYDCLVAGKNVLLVEPTKADIKDFQSRVLAIIDDLPESIRGDYTSREGLIQFKDIGTNLHLRSSGGRTSLRSVPVDTILVDEVSAIAALKLSQALSRLDASKDKTAIFVSTPDWPGRGISLMYLDGNCCQWQVKCKACGECRALNWEDFQLYEEAPERSFIRCPACQTPRSGDRMKWECKWVPTSLAAEGYESYHVSQLASHTVSDRELADKAIQAHRHPDLLRNWTNETLGLDWLPQDASRLQLHQVRACVRPFGNATLIPRDSTHCHVMGLDQGRVNTFAICRVDFPLGSTRHPLDCAVMTLVAAGESRESDWEAVTQLQREWQAWATVCDHAGSSARLGEEWARNTPYRSWLCRYVESTDIVEFAETDKASFPLILANRTWAISASQKRIKTGKIAIPADLSEPWLAQIPNAALDNTGKRYLKVGPDHLAHALAYAEIGLHLAVKHFGASIRYTRHYN